jgi:hypothetical protein
MRKIFYFLILAFIIFSFSKCYYYKEEVLNPVLANSCDTTNITYSGKVVPIFATNCLSCHGNAAVAGGDGGGIKLEDFPDLKANLNRAYGAMSHLPGFFPMPKGMSSTIDPCQIKIVRIWKDAGALNN